MRNALLYQVNSRKYFLQIKEQLRDSNCLETCQPSTCIWVNKTILF